MTTQELDALQALCDGATKGPWKRRGSRGQLIDASPDGEDMKTVVAETWGAFNGLFNTANMVENDAAFIAASRTALPALIAEVRRLTKRCGASENRLSAIERSIPRLCRTCQHNRNALCDPPCGDCRDNSAWEWDCPQPDKANDNRPT